MDLKDPLVLTKELCKKHSITPDDCNCQDMIASLLEKEGFTCEFIKKDGTTNLLAMHDSAIAGPYLMFLGHTDVVPAGDRDAWDEDPFATVVKQYDGKDYLIARGSSDMKGSVSAMTLALCNFVKRNKAHKGRLALLLTSNEEGDGKGGISYVSSLLKERNSIPTYCLVGEPSSEALLGDNIKIGRRGSITAHITVHGVQGHVAYPDRAQNAIFLANKLIDLLNKDLDAGNEAFPKTSFQVTNISAGTGTENVVPGSCYFMCNWRYNNLQSAQSIENFVVECIEKCKLTCDTRFVVNGKPFVTDKDSLLVKTTAEAIFELTGQKANLSTSGGTSDGRFIAPLGTEVIEFGPSSKSIHKVNEKVLVDDLYKLQDIYEKVIDKIMKS